MIKRPLMSPMKAPKARPITQTRTGGTPATARRPQVTTQTAMAEPTDRSMPPVMMAQVTPMARKPFTVPCSTISIRLPISRYLGAIIEKMTTIAASASKVVSSRMYPLAYFFRLFIAFHPSHGLAVQLPGILPG